MVNSSKTRSTATCTRCSPSAWTCGGWRTSTLRAAALGRGRVCVPRCGPRQPGRSPAVRARRSARPDPGAGRQRRGAVPAAGADGFAGPVGDAGSARHVRRAEPAGGQPDRAVRAAAVGRAARRLARTGPVVGTAGGRCTAGEGGAASTVPRRSRQCAGCRRTGRGSDGARAPTRAGADPVVDAVPAEGVARQPVRRCRTRTRSCGC